MNKFFTKSNSNSAGEILPLALPDTGLMISYSTKEFHLSSMHNSRCAGTGYSCGIHYGGL